MKWFTKSDSTVGYLPDETPPFWKLLLYAIQQVIVMFPATITVALITKFHISTTIFASGFATLCFILVTKGKIPLYYGSSFSYLGAIMGLLTTDYLNSVNILPDEKIAIVIVILKKTSAAHARPIVPIFCPIKAIVFAPVAQNI